MECELHWYTCYYNRLSVCNQVCGKLWHFINGQSLFTEVDLSIYSIPPPFIDTCEWTISFHCLINCTCCISVIKRHLHKGVQIFTKKFTNRWKHDFIQIFAHIVLKQFCCSMCQCKYMYMVFKPYTCALCIQVLKCW